MAALAGAAATAARRQPPAPPQTRPLLIHDDVVLRDCAWTLSARGLRRMPATTLAQQRHQASKGHAPLAKPMIRKEARVAASRQAGSGVRNFDRASDGAGVARAAGTTQPSRPSSRGANGIGAYFAKYSANAGSALAATVVHGRYAPGTRIGASWHGGLHEQVGRH
ncbi:MAG: hypothetical protein R3E41_07080 [Burkholderiaceae bacterium]